MVRTLAYLFAGDAICPIIRKKARERMRMTESEDQGCHNVGMRQRRKNPWGNKKEHLGPRFGDERKKYDPKVFS